MTVSILIPAFRPTFLRQTIASALAQGLEDFELIISDDSGGEDLLPVVERFRDPRIRYVRTSGRIGAAANCRSLWAQANRDRLIFLLDDDLLMPHAVVEMAAILDEHPKTSFCFAQRYTVDATGRIVLDPPAPRKTPMVMTHPMAVRSMVGRVTNVVGEFSNVLINRAVGLTVEDMLEYRGIRLRLLGDVNFFINATRKRPAIGISVPVGSFRRHDDQLSSLETNPKIYSLLGEWELLVRGEFALGVLTPFDANNATEILKKAYKSWLKRCPTFNILLPGLEQLSDCISREDRDVFTPAYLADFERFMQTFETPAA